MKCMYVCMYVRMYVYMYDSSVCFLCVYVHGCTKKQY